MDVSHFGLFDLTSRLPRSIDPPPCATADRIGGDRVGGNRIAAVRIANDNNRGAGPRRLPRPPRSLFRFMPRRGREPDLA